MNYLNINNSNGYSMSDPLDRKNLTLKNIRMRSQSSIVPQVDYGFTALRGETLSKMDMPICDLERQQLQISPLQQIEQPANDDFMREG